MAIISGRIADMAHNKAIDLGCAERPWARDWSVVRGHLPGARQNQGHGRVTPLTRENEGERATLQNEMVTQRREDAERKKLGEGKCHAKARRRKGEHRNGRDLAWCEQLYSRGERWLHI